jgi:hypothetical protein
MEDMERYNVGVRVETRGYVSFMSYELYQKMDNSNFSMYSSFVIISLTMNPSPALTIF